MYTIYILKLDGKKRFYIGVTSNFERRLNEHVRGLVKSTRYRYTGVMLTEIYNIKKEAWAREKWLKSSAGRIWITETLNI